MDKLCDWFSSARMSRYAAAVNPGALYVWDDRLSKAYLEDVAHVEILLRNFIASRLAVDYGRRYATEHGNWFDNLGTYNLDDKFGLIGCEGKASHLVYRQGSHIRSSDSSPIVRCLALPSRQTT